MAETPDLTHDAKPPWRPGCGRPFTAEDAKRAHERCGGSRAEVRNYTLAPMLGSHFPGNGINHTGKSSTEWNGTLADL